MEESGARFRLLLALGVFALIGWFGVDRRNDRVVTDAMRRAYAAKGLSELIVLGYAEAWNSCSAECVGRFPSTPEGLALITELRLTDTPPENLWLRDTEPLTELAVAIRRTVDVLSKPEGTWLTYQAAMAQAKAKLGEEVTRAEIRWLSEEQRRALPEEANATLKKAATQAVTAKRLHQQKEQAQAAAQAEAEEAARRKRAEETDALYARGRAATPTPAAVVVPVVQATPEATRRPLATNEIPPAFRKR